MHNEFTAVFEQDGDWFIGYCPEIAGANGQGHSLEQCRESLRETIALILEDRRDDGLRGVPEEAVREARSRFKKRRFAASRDAFNRALDLEPDGGNAWFNGGRANLALDDLEAAMVDLSRAIELDPERPERYYMRGQTLAKLDRHEDAVADFTRTLELKPTYRNGRRRRSDSFYKLGRYQAAIDDLTAALAADPDARLYYLRGKSLWGQRRPAPRADRFRPGGRPR